ncbi:hypothetical protein ACU4GD_39610 [Cupriavidus basilensis]
MVRLSDGGQVRADRAAGTSRARLTACCASRHRELRSGEAVHGAELESSLLLLNDIPGAEAKGTLQSGSEPGTTDLLVEAEPGPLAGGSLEADNYGGYYTGEYRLGGSFYLN